ncbi:unnamed protein product [Clonostachys rosea]|uniref:CsbD-like domain-containing protein n=1 Tax=Bionectria ochroleuca TaxID=29856 RepID=A0ABY6U7B8_BIOOC|nr:unnamed protein product [Clonostachys rosea]
MDFVKKAADKMGSSGTSNQQAQPAQGGQQDDYVDKAFGSLNNKQGWNIGKEQQEKITDGGRQAYEKVTGSKVNPKISN